MKTQLRQMTYQVELDENETLTLPKKLVESVGKGKWLITVQPETNGTVATNKSKIQPGSAKGKIKMLAGFDDPVEDFKDYM